MLVYSDSKKHRREIMVHLQESGEMYLETIYVLSKEGKRVRSIDVGE